MTDMCYNMIKPQKRYSKRKKPETKNYKDIWVNSYEMLRNGKLIQLKSDQWLPKDEKKSKVN